MSTNGLISIREAETLTGYRAEYLRELYRQGKVVGERHGWSIMLNTESLLRYAQEKGKIASR